MNRVRLPIEPNDLLAVLGLVMLGVGAALIYLPAGLLIVGSLLILYVYLATRPSGGPNP